MAPLEKVGEAFVEIRADFSRFNQQINSMSARMRKVGQRLQSVGRTMTTGITLPMGAAAAASGKFAADFDQNLQKVQSTAALTEAQVGAIGPRIEQVAETTGKSTDMIFQGFQKAISSQLDYQQSVKAVEEATKASAAGFGTQEELIITATTAMEVFGQELKTSTQFFDELLSVGRQSQVQVRELGSAFRRNANTAAQLGLELKETLATLASVSEQVGSTSRGGRLLQQVMVGLLSPTGQAQDALEKVGMTVEDLQANLADRGLTKTLVDLQDRLEEAGLGLENFFGSSRRLEGALTIVNKEGERTSEIMADARDSQGTLNEAFKESDNRMRQFNQAWQQVKGAFRDIGQALLPVIIPLMKDFADFVEQTADAFSNMPTDFQEMFVKIGAALSALGPALVVLGTAMVGLAGAISTVSAAITAMLSGAISPLGAALAAITTLLINEFAQVWDQQRSVWKNIQAIWQRAVKFGRNIFKQLQSMVMSIFGQLQTFWDKWGDTIQFIFNRGVKAIQRFAKNTRELFAAVLPRLVQRGEQIFQRFGDNTQGSLKAIADVILTLIERIPKFVQNIADLTREGKPLNFLLDTQIGFFNSIVDAINRVNRVINKLQRNWRELKTIFRGIKNFTEDIPSPVGPQSAFAGASPTDAFQSLSAGGQLSNQGITSTIGGLLNPLTGASVASDIGSNALDILIDDRRAGQAIIPNSGEVASQTGARRT